MFLHASVNLSDMSNLQLSSGSEVSDSAAGSLQSEYEDDHVFSKARDNRPAACRSRKECSCCPNKESRFCQKNIKDIVNDKVPIGWTTVLELFPWIVGLIWVIMQLTGVS